MKQDYPEMVVKSKWDEWRNRWFLVEVPEALPHLEEPKEHPVNMSTWRNLKKKGSITLHMSFTTLNNTN